MDTPKFRIWHKDHQRLYFVTNIGLDEQGKIDSVTLFDNGNSFEETDIAKVELRISTGKLDAAGQEEYKKVG